MAHKMFTISNRQEEQMKQRLLRITLLKRKLNILLIADIINEDTLLGYDCISILYTFFDDLSHSAQFPPNHSNKSLYFDAVKGYLNNSKVHANIANIAGQ
jgi:hypothetical protein